MSSFLKWTQSSRTAGAAAGPELEQRRRLHLALVVLVIALFVVVIRDIHDLRPPTPVNPEPATVSETSAPTAPAVTPAVTPAEVPEAPAKPATSIKSSRAKHARVKRPVVNAAQSVSGNDLSAGPTIVATDRAVLPLLQIEVVAGNQRQPLAPASNSVNVDMQSGGSPDPAQPTTQKAESDTAPPVDAPKVTGSRGVADRVAHSVAPSYPLLAKQMKVQGAVVLQALIDKGGRIQNLRVLSGPAILAAAAQEAVKQWRFKPYYQHGEPVETEARVSVNFTISTF